jgi:hypothetical protein
MELLMFPLGQEVLRSDYFAGRYTITLTKFLTELEAPQTNLKLKLETKFNDCDRPETSTFYSP